MSQSLADIVRERAGARCEYCLVPQLSSPLSFELDHVIAQQHGGATAVENLAWACLRCNKHKGPNLAGIDPTNGRIVRLFHPRKDRWSAHFECRGSHIDGRTAIGRATVNVLNVNAPEAIEFRQRLVQARKWPPT
jgi:hypothetical protein